MILSGHQPVYLPGIIVFNKIALSDAFMFVGHCDYQPKSWQSHNFIRGPNGPLKLTVPVKKGTSINETLIDGDHWKKKHLRSIEAAYKKRPFFEDYFPFFEEIIASFDGSLAKLNIMLIISACHWLGIYRNLFESQKLGITGHKTEMLFNMCKAVNATDYLSSPGETYVIPEQIKPYKHHFQVFEHPVYDQGAQFIPNLSVIDLLFNVGPRAGEIVRNAGHIGNDVYNS